MLGGQLIYVYEKLRCPIDIVHIYIYFSCCFVCQPLSIVFPLLPEMEQEQEQSQTSSSKTQAQFRIEKSQVVKMKRKSQFFKTRHNTTTNPRLCSLFSENRKKKIF